MKQNPTLRATLLIAFAALTGWTGEALAQGPTQVAVKVADMKVTMQKTPQFQASNVEPKKDGKAKEWLEVEIEFETRSDAKDGVIPEVLVQYYLAVKGTTQQILTDSFTYTNVIDKEPSFAVVYVSPPALTRVNGEMGGFKVSDVVAWGVEVLFNGRVVGIFSNSGGDWWTTAAAQRAGGMLMAKEDTPFRLLWIDRHLELKR